MANRREQKARYRRYRACTEQFPGSPPAAIDAVEPPCGAARVGHGHPGCRLEDLVEIVERSAAGRTSAAEVVGNDAVAFSETLLQNYPPHAWAARERQRLVHTVNCGARAEGATR
jgi:DNA-binding ferritin-like protein (Dps family)